MTEKLNHKQRLQFLGHPEFEKLLDILENTPKYKGLNLPKFMKRDLIRNEFVRWAFTGSDDDPVDYLNED